MDLPALRENIQNVATLVFKLLHKYAAAGLSKGDNFDLVVAAFKVSFTWIMLFINVLGQHIGPISMGQADFFYTMAEA